MIKLPTFAPVIKIGGYHATNRDEKLQLHE